MPHKKVFANATKDQAPSLSDVAELIKEGKAKRIVLMTGVRPLLFSKSNRTDVWTGRHIHCSRNP